jgi:hypothetical protein
MPRCQEIYQRYAALLYRQALRSAGRVAPAGHDGGGAIVNEHALAAIAGPVRGRRSPGPAGVGKTTP